jgi:hypothetical protein
VRGRHGATITVHVIDTEKVTAAAETEVLIDTLASAYDLLSRVKETLGYTSTETTGKYLYAPSNDNNAQLCGVTCQNGHELGRRVVLCSPAIAGEEIPQLADASTSPVRDNHN